MGSLDAVFLEIETPTGPMNIGSVAVFDGPAPSLEAVRAFVGAKIQRVPRCSQRALETWRNLARPVWIDDARFDVSDHVHHVSLSPEPLALEQFAERVMMLPLDRDRALWEMWVVEGLGEGRWAMVAKMHHCMVDGIAGTDLLSVIMDHEPDADVPPLGSRMATREPSTVEVLRFSTSMAIRSFWVHARRFASMLLHVRTTSTRLRHVLAGARGLWLQPSRRTSPLTGPIGPRRRWTHTLIPLGDVATIRHALGGTVNDVVLTVIAHGFRELLRTRGETLEGRDVMALVPVSMRGTDERNLLDNRVAVAHALLPVGIDDPVATYAALRRHMGEVKASHQTDASTLLLHTGEITPHAIASAVARGVVRAQQNIETIATNVPGPQEPLYLCGHRMLAAYPFAPIAGRIRIAIAIWSYCGTLYIGVTGDGDAASDLDPLVAGIDQSFNRLLGAAVS